VKPPAEKKPIGKPAIPRGEGDSGDRRARGPRVPREGSGESSFLLFVFHDLLESSNSNLGVFVLQHLAVLAVIHRLVSALRAHPAVPAVVMPLHLAMQPLPLPPPPPPPRPSVHLS
jgi:hypothetical protein